MNAHWTTISGGGFVLPINSTLIGFLLGILFYYIIENNNDNDFTPA